MRNNRDKFNKHDYNSSNNIAIEAMVGWLNNKIPDLILEVDENYGFDIRGKVNGGNSRVFYEVEVKKGWTGEWPDNWTDLRIPFRKKRLIDIWKKDYKDDLFTFIVFRKDLKKAWHIPADVVELSEVKEARNKNVAEGELFFHINVKDIYQVDMTYDNSSN